MRSFEFAGASESASLESIFASARALFGSSATSLSAFCAAYSSAKPR